MDPRRNLFFQYRGPSSEEDEFPRDRQLENNLTKALVDLLYYAPSAGRAALLSLLKAHSQTRSLPMSFQDGQLEVGMQSVPSGVENAPHRAVMLITAAGSAEMLDKEQLSEDRRGRPDAWVRARRDGSTLLIEAKLGPKVSPRQIQAHLNAARWPPSAPVIRTTWDEWFNALRHVRSTPVLPPVDCFLLDQFLEYLEVLGMAPFTGFQAQDFDFFIHFEPTYRPRLRQKLEQFAEGVRAALDPGIRRRYAEIRMGHIHSDEERGAWVALGPAGPTSFPHCNFTIEITRDRLEFNAVIRDGRANDSRKPIGILSRRLREDPLAFEQILHGLGGAYALTVFARTRVDGSIPPGRGNERWRFVATQRLGVVGEDVVRWVRFLIGAIAFPGIHVGRHISRGDQLLRNPEGLRDEGATSFRALSRVLEFLEK